MRGVSDGSGYTQTTEFTLQSEDFPALPVASQQQMLQNSNGGNSSNQANSSESQLTSGQTHFGAQSNNNFYNVANTANTTTSDFFSNGTNENGKDPKHNISINIANGERKCSQT